MGDQKSLLLEGKEFVCFILLRLHQGTVKGIKLDTEQGFAAQNPSTENTSVLHKYKRKQFALARHARVKGSIVSDNRARSTENRDAKMEVNRGVLVRLSFILVIC